MANKLGQINAKNRKEMVDIITLLVQSGLVFEVFQEDDNEYKIILTGGY